MATAATATTPSATEDGVTSAQRLGREASTAERNTTHGTFKKLAPRVGIAVFLFFLLGGIAGDIAGWWKEREAAKEAGDQSTPAASAASPREKPHGKRVEKNPIWEGWESGKPIPPNVWSTDVALPRGCRVTFAKGDAIRVQYRYYSKDWKEYKMGTSPNMSHLRFMVTEEGFTQLPYETIC